MIIGYARVSTKSQELDRQLDQLNEYGCDKIFSEKISGVKQKEELNSLKKYIRQGDVIVVEKFDRISRNSFELINFLNFIEENNLSFISLKDGEYLRNDISSKQKFFNLAVNIEFERDLIVQRVNEGLKAARARGRKGGRPRVNQQKLDQAIRLYNSREYSLKEIQEMTGVSTPTLYRYLKTKEEE